MWSFDSSAPLPPSNVTDGGGAICTIWPATELIAAFAPPAAAMPHASSAATRLRLIQLFIPLPRCPRAGDPARRIVCASPRADHWRPARTDPSEGRGNAEEPLESARN